MGPRLQHGLVVWVAYSVVKLTQYTVPRDVQVLLFGRIILIDDDRILAFILVSDEDVHNSPRPLRCPYGATWLVL